MLEHKLRDGVTLVLGGARSGKSAFAERIVEQSGLKPVYIATGHAYDDEMVRRVAQHVARRGNRWHTVEAPRELEAAIKDNVKQGNGIVVDCLTMWLTNLLVSDGFIPQRTKSLISALGNVSTPVVLVSNEVGLGIVPENKMAREFRDYAGRIHQDIAAIATEVYLVAAGLPLKMKG